MLYDATVQFYGSTPMPGVAIVRTADGARPEQRFLTIDRRHATRPEPAPGVTVSEVLAVTETELAIPDKVPEMML